MPLVRGDVQDATQDVALVIKESLDGNEVLGLSAVGYTGREIAELTGMCRKTVTLRLREARAANDNEMTGKKSA